MTTPPPVEAWALALQGIEQLQREMQAQALSLREMQAQLNDVRSAYTRAAPMSVHLALEERVSTLADRVEELETGGTAAILRRLDDDRRERRPDALLIAAALAALVVALIWLGVR